MSISRRAFIQILGGAALAMKLPAFAMAASESVATQEWPLVVGQVHGRTWTFSRESLDELADRCGGACDATLDGRDFTIVRSPSGESFGIRSLPGLQAKSPHNLEINRVGDSYIARLVRTAKA